MAGKLAAWTLNAAGFVLPKAMGVADELRRQFGNLTHRALGDEFEQRFLELSSKYSGDGADPFGADLAASRATAVGTAMLYRYYFRTEAHGVSLVPPGRVLLVANHSGQIPLDGAMIVGAMFLEADPPRLVRTMVDRWVRQLPAVSELFKKSGQVEGAPENCRELLARAEAVLVFPEGIRGISKPYRRRYQLERFGTGFMRLAMETDTPIVPVAVVGAEEQYISLGDWGWLKDKLGFPALPVIPQLLVPGGAMPLPTKYRIHFGEPMRFSGEPTDTHEVSENTWTVRQAIRSMLEAALAERSGVFS